MESESPLSINKELWLYAIGDFLDEHKKKLYGHDGKLRGFCKLLFGMAECRDVPIPDMGIGNAGSFLVDWHKPYGGRLFLCVVKAGWWRYTIKTQAKKHDGSITVVKAHHGEVIRGLFEDFFCVNSVTAESFLESVDKGLC